MIEAVGYRSREAAQIASLPLPGPKADALPADRQSLGGGVLGSGFYTSPVVRLDTETQRTVIEYRDAISGNVTAQYPSERQLQAYRDSLRQKETEALPRDLRRIPGDGSGEAASQPSRPTAARSPLGQTAPNAEAQDAPGAERSAGPAVSAAAMPRFAPMRAAISV